MTTAKVGVDLWALGRRAYEVHWPVLQALRGEPEIALGAVVSNVNADLAEYRALPLPLLTLALPAGGARAARFPLRLPGERRRLRQFLGDRRPLIHVTFFSPWDLFYLPVAKRAGATILVTIHDATRHPGEEHRLLQAAQDRVMRLADHVVVLSNHVADQLRRRGTHARPVHVLSKGLLTTAGPLLPPRGRPAGRSLRLLFFGRIVHYKGLDLLLDAVAALRRENLPVELTIAGAGDYEPYRDQLAGLDCVTVLDRWISVEDKNRLFAEHDVNMLPYREASQSGNALDGLFAAMPTIATRFGALVEQLGDGTDTIFADSATSPDIATAIRRLATEPGLYERLSAGAHASAKERGATQGARDWLALYRELRAR